MIHKVYNTGKFGLKDQMKNSLSETDDRDKLTNIDVSSIEGIEIGDKANPLNSNRVAKNLVKYILIYKRLLNELAEKSLPNMLLSQSLELLGTDVADLEPATILSGADFSPIIADYPVDTSFDDKDLLFGATTGLLEVASNRPYVFCIYDKDEVANYITANEGNYDLKALGELSFLFNGEIYFITPDSLYSTGKKGFLFNINNDYTKRITPTILEQRLTYILNVYGWRDDSVINIDWDTVNDAWLTAFYHSDDTSDVHNKNFKTVSKLRDLCSNYGRVESNLLNHCYYNNLYNSILLKRTANDQYLVYDSASDPALYIKQSLDETAYDSSTTLIPILKFEWQSGSTYTISRCKVYESRLRTYKQRAKTIITATSFPTNAKNGDICIRSDLGDRAYQYIEDPADENNNYWKEM